MSCCLSCCASLTCGLCTSTASCILHLPKIR
ncbi:hypothetical protein GLYMA_15G103333v4 [Glycine max]|nr:hypothetical protein GLYMA_15G103333v4 [Glycine max]